MAPRVLLVVVLAAALAGCGERSEPSSEPPPSEPPSGAEPAVAPPPAELPPAGADSACRVSPLGVLPAAARVQRLTLLPGSRSQPSSAANGFVLLVEGDRTELLRLSPAFEVLSRRALSTHVEAAVSVGDGVVVALATGPTDPSGVAHYRALRLGASAAEDTELPLPVPVRAGGAIRRNATGEQVVFTWTNGREPPVALRLHAPESGPLRFDAPYTLSPEVDLEDGLAVQLLRVALDEGSFAAIVRVGSAEGIGSEVWLARPTGRAPVHALEDIADIEAMAVVGDQVWVIATYEFSRPLLLRIRPDGELAEDPLELARDATLPPELAGGDPARLLVDGDRLLLRRRNPMGDPLLPDALVATRAEETLPADVLRDAQRYVVVYQDRDAASESWPIRFASLDCAPR